MTPALRMTVESMACSLLITVALFLAVRSADAYAGKVIFYLAIPCVLALGVSAWGATRRERRLAHAGRPSTAFGMATRIAVATTLLALVLLVIGVVMVMMAEGMSWNATGQDAGILSWMVILVGFAVVLSPFVVGVPVLLLELFLCGRHFSRMHSIDGQRSPGQPA